MARDERRGRLDRPVAVRGVDVGVAETGGLDLDPDLAGLEREPLDLLDDERGAERLDDGCPVRGGRGRGRIWERFGCRQRIPPMRRNASSLILWRMPPGHIRRFTDGDVKNYARVRLSPVPDDAPDKNRTCARGLGTLFAYREIQLSKSICCASSRGARQ